MALVLVVFSLLIYTVSAYTDADNDDYCLESVTMTECGTNFPAGVSVSNIADLRNNKLVYADSIDNKKLMLFDLNTQAGNQIGTAFSSNIANIRFIEGYDEVALKFSDNTFKVVNINTGAVTNLLGYDYTGYSYSGIFKVNSNYYTYRIAEFSNSVSIHRMRLSGSAEDVTVASRNEDLGGGGVLDDIYYRIWLSKTTLDGGGWPVFFYYKQTGSSFETNYVATINPNTCTGSTCVLIDMDSYSTGTSSQSNIYVAPSGSKADNNVLVLTIQDAGVTKYGVYDLTMLNQALILTSSSTLFMANDINNFVYNGKLYQNLVQTTRSVASKYTLIDNKYFVNVGTNPKDYFNYVTPAQCGPAACPLGGNDCNDNNPNLNVPPCIIPCTDLDGDGYGATGTDLSSCAGSTTTADCDDTSADANPGITAENNPNCCTDGLDNDCDGQIDSADLDCTAPTCESFCGSSCLYGTCYDPVLSGQNCYWVDTGIIPGIGNCYTVTPTTVCSDLVNDQTACESTTDTLNCLWDGTACQESAISCGDTLCDSGETITSCPVDCGCGDDPLNPYPSPTGCTNTAYGTCDNGIEDYVCSDTEYCGGCSDCALPGEGGCKLDYFCDNIDVDIDENVGCELFDPNSITSCGNPDLDPYCVPANTEQCLEKWGVITVEVPTKPFTTPDGVVVQCCTAGLCATLSVDEVTGEQITLEAGLCVAEPGQSTGIITYTYQDGTTTTQPCTLSLGKRIPFYDYIGVLLTIFILIGYYLLKNKK